MTFLLRRGLDTLKGPQHVEHAVALEAALATKIGRALAEDLFDSAWLTDQLVVASHQHRRSSTDVRRGHAGAVELSPVTIQQRRFDSFTRRHQIGLETTVAGRTTAREKANPVGMWFKTVSGADCDHPVSVARISNAESSVTFERSVLGLKALITEITRSGHNDNSTLNQPLAFVANRCASASEVTHVVRNRETQVRAMNREIGVPFV